MLSALCLSICRWRAVISFVTLTLGLPWCAAAERPVEGSWPVHGGARVSVDVPDGRLEVRGWDRREVALEGHLAAGVSDLEVQADGHKVRLAVSALEASAREDRSVALTLRVPRDCLLRVQSFSADVDVSDLLALVDVHTLDGDIHISGRPDEVRTRTLAGDQRLDIESRRLTVRGIEGPLHLAGAVQSVVASSVSGSMTIESRLVGEMKLRSTSGRILFSGEIVPTGRLDVETTGGPVEFDLAPPAQAEVHLASRKGDIEVDVANGSTAQDVATALRAQGAAEQADRPLPIDTGTVRRLILGGGGPQLRAVSQWGDLRLVYRSSTQ